MPAAVRGSEIRRRSAHVPRIDQPITALAERAPCVRHPPIRNGRRAGLVIEMPRTQLVEDAAFRSCRIGGWRDASAIHFGDGQRLRSVTLLDHLRMTKSQTDNLIIARLVNMLSV